MTRLKRPAAVFGFSLLFSLIILLLFGIHAIYVCTPLFVILSAAFLIRRSNTALYLISITACFLSAAVLLTVFDHLKYEPSLRYVGENTKITGTVSDYPQSHPSSQSIILKHCKFNNEQTRYSVKIYFTDGSFPLPGDQVTLTASEIFSSADKESKFFYHTLSGGTWLSAFCRGGLSVKENPGRSLSAHLAKLRYSIRNKASAFMNNDLAAVSAAIVTGDQSDIPDGIRDCFRKSGVSHLFAVSGMHLSVWTGLIFSLLRKRSRIRLLPNLFALLFIWLYAAFTGFSPSVLRAGIMLSLICIGTVLRKHADPVNALGVSAVLLLTVNPWLAGNISFLLSFTATFAIVGIFPVLNERSPQTNHLIKNKLLNAKESILLSVLILFITIPFTAYFFGYASILAPITSLLCTPLAELMMISSALGAVIPTNFFLTRFIYLVCASLTNAIVKITEKAASFEFAILPLRQGYVVFWFLICAAFLTAFLFIFKTSRTVILNTLLALLSAALLTGIVFTGLTANDYTVYIPESGNAAMISVVSGTGSRSLLLGCGGDYDTFRNTKEFLQSRTAFSPDYVFIPRKGKAQTEQLVNILKYLPPEHLFLPTDIDLVRGTPENTAASDSFNCDIWNGISLQYENAEEYNAGILEINGTKIVFSFYPASASDGENEKYLSGDYLICRGAIPAAFETDRFTSVIVLSDKTAQALSLPANAISTADTGDITLTLRRQY